MIDGRCRNETRLHSLSQVSVELNQGATPLVLSMRIIPIYPLLIRRYVQRPAQCSVSTPVQQARRWVKWICDKSSPSLRTLVLSELGGIVRSVGESSYIVFFEQASMQYCVDSKQSESIY